MAPLGPHPWPESEGRRLILPWVVVWVCVAMATLSPFLGQPGQSSGSRIEYAFLIRHQLGGIWWQQRLAPSPPKREAVQENLATLNGPATVDGLAALHLAVGQALGLGTAAGLAQLDKARTMDLGPASQQLAQCLEKAFRLGPQALSPADQDLLQTRCGWLGRAAPMASLPPQDPRRVAIERSAMTTFVVTSLGQWLLLLGLLVGVFVLFIGRLRWYQGRIGPVYLSTEEPTGVFIEGFAGLLVTFLLFNALLKVTGLTYDLWLLWLFLAMLPIWYFWLRRRGLTEWDLAEGLGWEPGDGFLAEAWAGILGLLAGLPLLLLGYGVGAMVVQEAAGSSPFLEYLARPGANLLRWLTAFITVCLWAPLVEESLFRGALYHHLRSLGGASGAALVSSLIFALLHVASDGLSAAPPIFILGLILAFLREWRGSLIAPLIAHTVYNFINLTWAFLMVG